MKPFNKIKNYINNILIAKFNKEFTWSYLIYDQLEDNDYYSGTENSEIRQFIRNCPFINREDVNGDTLINVIADGNFVEKHDTAALMADFMAAGGNIHHNNKQLKPPMVQAIDVDHQFFRDKVILLLLKYKANVNAQDYSGNTALMLGIKKKISNLKILLTPELDVTIPNRYGETALELCKKDLNDPFDFNNFVGPAEDLQKGPRTVQRQKEMEELTEILTMLFERVKLQQTVTVESEIKKPIL